MIRFFVMAGLAPAIHVLLVVALLNMDARDKPGHDEFRTRKTPAA
jgi:hypothetical protein